VLGLANCSMLPKFTKASIAMVLVEKIYPINEEMDTD
jgi:hypothetical protein